MFWRESLLELISDTNKQCKFSFERRTNGKFQATKLQTPVN